MLTILPQGKSLIIYTYRNEEGSHVSDKDDVDENDEALSFTIGQIDQGTGYKVHALTISDLRQNVGHC